MSLCVLVWQTSTAVSLMGQTMLQIFLNPLDLSLQHGGLILLSTKALGFLPGDYTFYSLCAAGISPAGTVVVGMQINSSIMQPVSNAWSRHLSFFFSLSTSNGVLFRLKWESPCQCHHLLKNDETDWRMRPGWYSCLKARGLINLSGVAHVGKKLRLKLSWRRRRWR